MMADNRVRERECRPRSVASDSQYCDDIQFIPRSPNLEHDSLKRFDQSRAVIVADDVSHTSPLLAVCPYRMARVPSFMELPTMPIMYCRHRSGEHHSLTLPPLEYARIWHRFASELTDPLSAASACPRIRHDVSRLAMNMHQIVNVPTGSVLDIELVVGSVHLVTLAGTPPRGPDDSMDMVFMRANVRLCVMSCGTEHIHISVDGDDTR
jgi:hypothetical protein